MAAVRPHGVLGLCSEAPFALWGVFMDNISYTTVEQQIEKLKSQGLFINDEREAKESLRLYGYSNLIKSYREPYIITSENKKIYRTGVSFEQIFSLYTLDKNLRNGVMAAMQDLEEYIKEVAADVLAGSFGTHQDNYLRYKNFRNKTKRISRFSLKGILDTMQRTLETDKDPIHHYSTVHGIVPPWILFKSIYFSTIINFIDQFKINEQNTIAYRLYDIKHSRLSIEQARKLMFDTLYICLEYRNLAAHGGRIYNYDSLGKLRTNEIFGNKNQYDVSGFSKLLFTLSFLNYKNPFRILNEILDIEVNRHCQLFPLDVTYLGNTLNLNITAQKIVYISDLSNKFHNFPYCSGMKNAKAVDFARVKDKYIPCKRCARTEDTTV